MNLLTTTLGIAAIAILLLYWRGTVRSIRSARESVRIWRDRAARENDLYAKLHPEEPGLTRSELMHLAVFGRDFPGHPRVRGNSPLREILELFTFSAWSVLFPGRAHRTKEQYIAKLKQDIAKLKQESDRLEKVNEQLVAMVEDKALAKKAHDTLTGVVSRRYMSLRNGQLPGTEMYGDAVLATLGSSLGEFRSIVYEVARLCSMPPGVIEVVAATTMKAASTDAAIRSELALRRDTGHGWDDGTAALDVYEATGAPLSRVMEIEAYLHTRDDGLPPT